MRCEKRGDGQGTFTDVVQHCLHLIGWLLLLIVVRFQLGTFAENHFALEETSDLSAKRRNRSVDVPGIVLVRLTRIVREYLLQRIFSVPKLLKSFNIQIMIGQKLFSMISAWFDWKKKSITMKLFNQFACQTKVNQWKRLIQMLLVMKKVSKIIAMLLVGVTAKKVPMVPYQHCCKTRVVNGFQDFFWGMMLKFAEVGD